MMKLSNTFKPLLILLFVLAFSYPVKKAKAQEYNALEIVETVVDFYTKKKLEGVTVVILEKRDDGTWEEYARTATDKKASVSSQLYLQKEYLVVFSKKGYIKKKILIDTRMDGADEDFYEHDNILFLTNRVVSDQDSASLLDKPVVRVYFSKERKGFVFDSLYTASIKKEINSLPADLTEKLIKRLETNAQTDVVDPADLAKAEKEYQDLLDNVDAERIKREQEELLAAAARAKAIQDSIDLASGRTKFIADSIALAQKRAQEVADSLARINAENAKILAAKLRRDSIAAAKALAYANRPVVTSTTTPNPVPTPTVSTVEEEDAPLISKAIVLDAKMQEEMFDKTSSSADINAARAAKLAAEKIKMDNMNVKYQTGSPFISLLDEIDYYEKAQKNKANKP